MRMMATSTNLRPIMMAGALMVKICSSQSWWYRLQLASLSSVAHHSVLSKRTKSAINKIGWLNNFAISYLYLPISQKGSCSIASGTWSELPTNTWMILRDSSMRCSTLTKINLSSEWESFQLQVRTSIVPCATTSQVISIFRWSVGMPYARDATIYTWPSRWRRALR